MTTDLLLAIAHHLLAFCLVAALAMELVIVRPGLSRAELPRLGRIDGAYGGMALAIILVGIGRVLYGLKGWEFYVYNHAFWAKMAAFVLVGLLSIPPTLRIIRWRRAAGETVPEAEIASMRRWLKAEAIVLAFVPIFAAAMARGIGY